MGDISPLRRRMIEEMTVRNLSPATNDPISTLCGGSAAISADRPIGLILTMFTASRFTLSQRGYPGRR